MRLDRVTITGADDSTEIGGLYQLTNEFPFVEWGILLSKSSAGRSRFPSYDWFEELRHYRFKEAWTSGRLSGHICGRWVRDICKGDWSSFIVESPNFVPNRWQLNFHAITHKIDRPKFIEQLKEHVGSVFSSRSRQCDQIIFQLDDVNNDIFDLARENNIDAVPLFDISGGAGVLPSEWPKPRDCYCGYAGGLGPENLEAQLKKIESVVGDAHIWIDMETRVRSADDQVFDLNKVHKCLSIAKRFIKES